MVVTLKIYILYEDCMPTIFPDSGFNYHKDSTIPLS